MDSALLAVAGIDAVVLRPRGGGVHGPEGWVDLDSVYQVGEILIETARGYCGVEATHASRA